MEITFIGLGIMGSRMAKNLIKKGFKITVWNRTKDKADELVKSGAVWGNTLFDAVKNCDVLFTMLSTPQAVEQLTPEILKSMKKNSLWVDSTTVNPSFSRKMSSFAKEHGLRFLEAPVAGSKIPAENAQLVIYTGGDKNDLEQVRPMLEAVSKAVIYIGETGMGSAMKIVNNVLLASAMVSFSEALVLGESLGLTKEMIFDTLGSSAVAAPFVNLKRQKIMDNNFEPEFPLQWMHKDLQLASEEGYNNRIALPLANSLKEIYSLAKLYGMSEEDMSAVYKFLKGIK